MQCYCDILLMGNREYDQVLASIGRDILDDDTVNLVGLPQQAVDEIIEALDGVNPYGYTLGLRAGPSSPKP